MRILFVGGTGVISSACSRLAVERGHDLYLLNRGETTKRPVPPGARVLHGDIRDAESAGAALGGRTFDVVVDWIAYTPDHIEADLRLFRDRAAQYVFVSSAAAYQTTPAHVPLTEETPLENRVWLYAQNKIACEKRLERARREEGFPVTVVRPSHTYDRTLNPVRGGYTVIDRMRRGRRVVVAGDGTGLWTLTHHEDFAKGLVGLLGNPRAVGEAFHITSDEVLTWNQVYLELARAAGVEPRLVHVPSELIATYDGEWGASLLGDKAHSKVFDNSKIKRFVPGYAATIPFAQGAREIVDWFDADPANRPVDERLDGTMERIVAAIEAWRPAPTGS